MAQPKTLPLIVVEEGAVAAAGLGKSQAQWAAANGFTGQRGRLLPLPSESGGLDGYLFGVGPKASRPVLGDRPCRRRPGAGPLQPRRCDRRSDLCGARLPARRLSVRSLQAGQGGPRPGAAGRRRCRRSGTSDRCGVPRPRPHQHAAQRSRSGCVREGNSRLRHAPQDEAEGDRRRRFAEAEFPDDPRRRTRLGRGTAAARHDLGQGRAIRKLR